METKDLILSDHFIAVEAITGQTTSPNIAFTVYESRKTPSPMLKAMQLYPQIPSRQLFAITIGVGNCNHANQHFEVDALLTPTAVDPESETNSHPCETGVHHPQSWNLRSRLRDPRNSGKSCRCFRVLTGCALIICFEVCCSTGENLDALVS
jgi:hypothetical protein